MINLFTNKEYSNCCNSMGAERDAKLKKEMVMFLLILDAINLSDMPASYVHIVLTSN